MNWRCAVIVSVARWQLRAPALCWQAQIIAFLPARYRLDLRGHVRTEDWIAVGGEPDDGRAVEPLVVEALPQTSAVHSVPVLLIQTGVSIADVQVVFVEEEANIMPVTVPCGLLITVRIAG